MNICLVRQDESAGEVNITLGEVVIGRGDLLGCTDKRVSRQHARIKLSEDGDVIIEATHTNPVFYIKGEKPSVKVNKDNFVIISDGDEFALLPDSYRFRVIIPSEVESNQNGHIQDETKVEVQNTDPVDTGNSYKRYLPSWMTNLAKDDVSNDDIKASSSSKTIISSRKRKDAVKNENVVKKKKIQLDNGTSERNSNSNSNDDDAAESNKEPEKTKLHEVSDEDEGGKAEEQKMKIESGESSEDKSNNAAQVKVEPGNSSEDESNNAAQTSDQSTNVVADLGSTNGQKREKCIYGAGCYRRNTHHRVEFSHPGDPDYDDKDLPECPYGITCYRKNKQHRLDFKHTTRPQRAKKQQNNLPGLPLLITVNYIIPDEQTTSDDEDDYDNEDPFLNDASSDDYQPTDTESEPSAGVSSEEEESDTNRMMKEAKKFTGKKK